MQVGTKWGGNYSRFSFDELKRHYMLLKEQGVPILDDEFNLLQEAILTNLRRWIQDVYGDAAVGTSFKIEGTGAANDFTIKGGDGTASGAAHLYVAGYLIVLPSDTTYAGQPIAQAALTTPGGARADEVYLDVWLDEVGPADDATIVDPALAIETNRRLQLKWAVKVAEGGAVPAAYTDADNLRHHTYRLATLNRTAQAGIDAGMVVDRRRVLVAMPTHVEDGGAHGATSAATANTIVRRDANGRAKVAAPGAADDIARKDTVDAHADLTAPHGATSAATANRLMLRDAAGRAKIAAPTAADDIARKDTVDAVIPAGTAMLFQQSTAPVGWTKQTAHNDKALRVVSGVAGYGGSLAFSTAFANRGTNTVWQGGTIGSTTLDANTLPSHRHRLMGGNWMASTTDGLYNSARTIAGRQPVLANEGYYDSGPIGSYIENSGASWGHAHPFYPDGHSHAVDMSVQYVDTIIATKN